MTKQLRVLLCILCVCALFLVVVACKESRSAQPGPDATNAKVVPEQQGGALPKVASRRVASATSRPVVPPAPRIPWGKREAVTQLHVRFFAAGHGDAILLRTPAGHNLLIDAGRGDVEQLGDHLVSRRLLPFFIKRGIRWLDGFFITHPHWDHFGDPVALRRVVRFDQILTNADSAYLLPQYDQGLPQKLFRPLYRGWRKTYGKLLLEVLHPPTGGASPERVDGVLRHNNRSLVIRATYGKIVFLLTGDLMYGGEWKMLKSRLHGKRLPGRAHVLKLGHHGLGSTSATWLRAIRPRYAVATCGDKWRQRYDYLPSKLYQRLSQFKVRLFRSDRDGDVVFRTDGEKLAVKTYKSLIHVPVWKQERRRKRLERRKQQRRKRRK